MKVFNEEVAAGKGMVVILLDSKEAAALVEMATAAVEANKRKSVWKKLHKILAEDVAVF